MRKILMPFVAMLTMLMVGGCHKDSPSVEFPIYITETFKPLTKVYDRHDESEKEEFNEWSGKLLIVNSADELPDDPFGFTDIYRSLPYSSHSLLIRYQAEWFEWESYSNSYYRNTVENTYNWAVSLVLAVTDDEELRYRHLTRFAILVPKLPEGADVRSWTSYHTYSNTWD